MLSNSLQTACLLGVLCVVVLSAYATNARRDLLPLNRSPRSFPVAFRAIISQLEARTLTNAKRLAAGLLLKPPQRRGSGITLVHAPWPNPSSSPTAVQGYIEAFEVSTNTSQGYISATYDSHGQAGLITTNSTQFMVFSLTSGTSGPMNIQTTNGPNSDYPFLGGIQGNGSSDASISPSSANFVYLGGTVETNPGSGPVRRRNTFSAATGGLELIESAIWSYDPSRGSLTAQWVNPNCIQPTTFIGFTGGFLFLTGNETLFTDSFGAATWLDLTFRPIV